MNTEKLNRSSIIAAAILSLGIIILGYSIKSGIRSISDSKRTVSVRGLAERTVTANHVTMPFIYEIYGNDLPAMYAEVKSKNAKIINFITAKGIDRKSITAAPPSVHDFTSSEIYSSNNTIPYRYSIREVISLSSDQVMLANELESDIFELTKEGITLQIGDYENAVNYEFTKLNSIKPAMIQEATKNARVAAQKFADDSQSKLGGICSATQGNFSISAADSLRRYNQKVRVVTTVSFFLDD